MRVIHLLLFGMIFISSTLIKLTDLKAVLSIKLISYSNPSHRLKNGRCCEQGIEPECRCKPSCEKCTLDCDNLFHINLTQNYRNESKQYDVIKTNIIAYKDKFTFDSSLADTIKNPIEYQVDEVEGQFILNILTYDDDEGVIDLADESENKFILSNLSKPGIMQETTELNGTVSTLILRMWYQCDIDYYGEYCGRYCAGKNDINGHYSCDNITGNIICLPGWKNAIGNCTEKDSNATVQSSFIVASLVQPTKSSSGGFIATSVIERNTTIDETLLLLQLNGEFAEFSDKEFHEELKQILQDEITSKCFKKMAIKVNVNLHILNFTTTHAHVNVSVNYQGKIIIQNITACIGTTMMESYQLNKKLKATEVSISTNNGGAYIKAFTRRAKNEEDDNDDGNTSKALAIVFGVLSGLVVVVLLLFLILRQKKRSRKIAAKNMLSTYNAKDQTLHNKTNLSNENKNQNVN